jgi:uncharacterized membrane protein (TIGR01666 family)
MLGIQLFPEWYIQPALLMAGASWYYLLTLLIRCLAIPNNAINELVAEAYARLAHYLEIKAECFDPDLNLEKQYSPDKEALASSLIVEQLNLIKLMIISQMDYQSYSKIQDIYDYIDTSRCPLISDQETSFYDEVLSCLCGVMRDQADVYRKLSRTVPNQPIASSKLKSTYSSLEQALNYLTENRLQITHFAELTQVIHNLEAISNHLIFPNKHNLIMLEGKKESRSGKIFIRWQSTFSKLKSNITPSSRLFRHAIRMAILLSASYIFVQVTQIERGYWILLTSLFVCQSKYSVTTNKIKLRIMGTLVGTIFGLPILWLLPSLEIQLALIILSGVLFFIFRQYQYGKATSFITLLVLLCFNLMGEGFEVAFPRLMNTLLGCALSWLAALLIWPDWHHNRASDIVLHSFKASGCYLQAILKQYSSGKEDSEHHMSLRIEAYNANLELASFVSDTKSRVIFSEELLLLNGAFLKEISILGIHRNKLINQVALDAMGSISTLVDQLIRSDMKYDYSHSLVSLEHEIKKYKQKSVNPRELSYIIMPQMNRIIIMIPKFLQLYQNME